PAAARPPLPAPRSPLVDRVAEAAAARAALLGADGRLVTLTGPGGVGKTHLALQVAADVAGRFADGVAFVPLAGVADPQRVLPVAAQALGVDRALGTPGSGGPTLGQAVLGYLRGRRLLVVLDNVEQVLPAAPLVALGLDEAPGLTVLATSREPLH